MFNQNKYTSSSTYIHLERSNIHVSVMSVYCFALLTNINLRIPWPTRSADLFVHIFFKTNNYLKFGPYG